MTVPVREVPPPPDAGAADDRLDLDIGGMHCASCVSRVEQALTSVPGVARAHVNLATERAHVEVQRPVAVASLTEAVRHAGYEAQLAADAATSDRLRTAARAAAMAALRRRVMMAAALGLPVVVLGNFGMLPPFHAIPEPTQNWIQLLLATPVQWWAGWPFVRGAFAAIRRRTADMDLLVGLGTTSA